MWINIPLPWKIIASIQVPSMAGSSSKELRRDKKGRKVIWYKVGCQESGTGIALVGGVGLESREEMQSR